MDKGESLTRWTGLARRIVDHVRQRPMIVAAVAAALFMVKPKKFVSLASTAWSLWQLYSRLRKGFQP